MTNKDDRFELRVTLPRRTKVSIGRVGYVELELDRLPNELLTGMNGLVIKGLTRLLGDAIHGEKSVRSAEETVACWYRGIEHRRAAGALLAEIREELDRRGGSGRDVQMAKEAAEKRVQKVLDVIRELAARATGEEALRTAARRSIERKLGPKRFAAIERSAEEMVGEG